MVKIQVLISTSYFNIKYTIGNENPDYNTPTIIKHSTKACIPMNFKVSIAFHIHNHSFLVFPSLYFVMYSAGYFTRYQTSRNLITRLCLCTYIFYTKTTDEYHTLYCGNVIRHIIQSSA